MEIGKKYVGRFHIFCSSGTLDRISEVVRKPMLTVFSLKNPGRGFVLIVFSLKNPGRVDRVLSKKNYMVL